MLVQSHTHQLACSSTQVPQGRILEVRVCARLYTCVYLYIYISMYIYTPTYVYTYIFV